MNERDLQPLLLKHLGMRDYVDVWNEMRDFTNTRNEQTLDELWLVQHPAVFTLGQAGKSEHLLTSSDIPVVKTDRGGQVTFHGPGQLVAYPLLNIRRLNFGVRELVTRLESSVIQLLDEYNIPSAAKDDAPGVYVDGKKIASLGLRVRKGCSFHGVSINIDMDLAPFLNINPCGYAGLEMTKITLEEGGKSVTFDEVAARYPSILAEKLGLSLASS